MCVLKFPGHFVLYGHSVQVNTVALIEGDNFDTMDEFKDEFIAELSMP
jgi:hypothetical protein